MLSSGASNDITITTNETGNIYLLGNDTYINYTLDLGRHNFNLADSNHPIRLFRANPSKIKIVPNSNTNQTTINGKTYYSGQFTIEVYEDFGTISYKCRPLSR